jgi:Fe-S-cluster-containing dehydrogenase component
LNFALSGNGLGDSGGKRLRSCLQSSVRWIGCHARVREGFCAREGGCIGCMACLASCRIERDDIDSDGREGHDHENHRDRNQNNGDPALVSAAST